MATKVNVIKNTFNKSQFKKYNAILQLVRMIPRENYPNGNSGYSDSVIRNLFSGKHLVGTALFRNILQKKVKGDAYSVGFVSLNPSLLTSDQLEKLEKALTDAEGEWQKLDLSEFKPI